MSGPFLLGDMAGAINSFAIGAYPEINGLFASMMLDFELVDDEEVFTVTIGGKLTGKTIACPGRNVNTTPVCQRAGALTPRAR